MTKPIKIGILSSPIKNHTLSSALKFLVLSQNTLQKSIEFAFMPEPPESVFLNYLASKEPISRPKVKIDAGPFLSEYWNWLRTDTKKYNSSAEERFPIIFVSNTTFYDNYYSIGLKDWGVIALGNWKRYMAPPSILEFFVVLIVERAVKLSCEFNLPGNHLTTKGCLFDFTADLTDARYSILTGFICNRCRMAISELHSESFVKDIELLISMTWIGSREDHTSIATNTKKLGYDLFLTKGIEPTVFERLVILFEEEGVKTFLKILAGVALAGLLILFELEVI